MAVGVNVGMSVGVAVGEGVGVAVKVAVAVGVAVEVDVGRGVLVGVDVAVTARVGIPSGASTRFCAGVGTQALIRLIRAIKTPISLIGQLIGDRRQMRLTNVSRCTLTQSASTLESVSLCAWVAT